MNLPSILMRPALALAVVVAFAACGDDERGFGPGGGVGGPCGAHHQCPTGHCCTSGNCGGGMCTYRCDRDFDCPGGMGCEHGVCFFACRGDFDCGPRQSCEHDGVCEY